MWSFSSEETKVRKLALKDLQDKIMESTEVPGTKENSMVCNGVINQWHFHNPKATDVRTPTLLIHGYGASTMAYHRTFNQLSHSIQDLYAIDLPANGLSLAPPPKFQVDKNLEQVKINYLNDNTLFKRTSTIDQDKSRKEIAQLEDYYLDYMENWRKENKLDKINLVGHSFGGYISYKYALRYPSAVSKLCLVSPLGVESNVYSINNDFEKGKEYAVDLEDPSSQHYTRLREVPSFLFENQLKVLRWIGPLGKKLCWNYISTAYSKVPSLVYKEYLLEFFTGDIGIPPVTVSLFTNLFTRRLLAKDPIMDSIDKLKADKLLLLYGSHDWMNRTAGYALVNKFNKSRSNSKEDAYYTEVPDAGHNLFLDNPDFFSSKLASFLREKN